MPGHKLRRALIGQGFGNQGDALRFRIIPALCIPQIFGIVRARHLFTRHDFNVTHVLFAHGLLYRLAGLLDLFGACALGIFAAGIAYIVILRVERAAVVCGRFDLVCLKSHIRIPASLNFIIINKTNPLFLLKHLIKFVPKRNHPRTLTPFSFVFIILLV